MFKLLTTRCAAIALGALLVGCSGSDEEAAAAKPAPPEITPASNPELPKPTESPQVAAALPTEEAGLAEQLPEEKPQTIPQITISDKVLQRIIPTSLNPGMGLSIGRELGLTAREENHANEMMTKAWQLAKDKRLALMEDSFLTANKTIDLPKLDAAALDEVKSLFWTSLRQEMSDDHRQILYAIFEQRFVPDFAEDLKVTMKERDLGKREFSSSFSSRQPGQLVDSSLVIEHENGDVEVLNPNIQPKSRFNYLQVDPALKEGKSRRLREAEAAFREGQE